MTTAPYDILLYAAAGASLLMVLLWLRQYRTRDASSVDVAWAAGVGALASRGDDYRAYQRATSVFIPWFPRDPGKADATYNQESTP